MKRVVDMMSRQLRRAFLICSMSLSPVLLFGQTQPVFSGHIENKDYGVYVVMDFYHEGVSVPGQELFGQVPGFLAQTADSRKWIIVSCKVVKPTQAELTMVNDYGSEDLTATLTLEPDGTYTLRQTEGSPLKIVANRKWVKLPKKLTLKR